LIFSLRLRLVPVVGSGTAVDMILPAITLALPMMAVIARLTRSSVLDAARADYVMTAHGKGVPGRKVWRRHILKNALVPVVTMIGLNCGHLLGGTFVVETIFSWPGLGRMIVQAVFEKDYPVILGSIVLLALIFQICNLMIDLAHGVLDPRVGSEAV
jgi:peptide/nickel transport system permease protein